jgi:hypothetical protein
VFLRAAAHHQIGVPNHLLARIQLGDEPLCPEPPHVLGAIENLRLASVDDSSSTAARLDLQQLGVLHGWRAAPRAVKSPCGIVRYCSVYLQSFPFFDLTDRRSGFVAPPHVAPRCARRRVC